MTVLPYPESLVRATTIYPPITHLDRCLGEFLSPLSSTLLPPIGRYTGFSSRITY